MISTLKFIIKKYLLQRFFNENDISPRVIFDEIIVGSIALKSTDKKIIKVKALRENFENYTSDLIIIESTPRYLTSMCE